MASPHLDLDVLRSFATGVALGSYAQAADKLGRSTSAVSAQLKKLESQTGVALLRKAGRGLELTEAGHTLLAYAHRLLDLNDEAVAAVRATDLQGQVRLGLPEDLGEAVLPSVLGRFARTHPRLQVQVLCGKSDELQALYDSGLLDVVMRWDAGQAQPSGGAQRVASLPLCWIGPGQGAAERCVNAPWWPLVIGQAPTEDQPALPLVLLTDPCPLRAVVVDVLNQHGLPWRLAFSSPSLSALWAATAAGLGVAVRTRLGLPAHVAVLDALESPGLPALPAMSLVMHSRSGQPPVEQLAQLLSQTVAEQVAALPSP